LIDPWPRVQAAGAGIRVHIAMAVSRQRAIGGRSAVVALALIALGLLAPAGAHAIPDARLVGSRAIAPRSAPPAVKAMIAAANHIRHKPYVWGGGHVHWRSRGYDCSGSVSYVLHRAGLLDYPLDSTGLMHWGKGGHSKWVTIYASHDHAYMVIAGLRWDTSMVDDGDRTGPGWSELMRPRDGFRLRHPGGSRRW
jgi:hypothetical protein